MSPLKASVVMNLSAVYLHGEIQTSKHNPNKDRLDLTWHETDLAWNRCGMNRLDSPTAGNNINTRQELKARTWLLIANTERHMTRTNQWRHDTMNMTHITEEPIARRYEGKGSMTQTVTETNLQNKWHENMNMKLNQKQILHIPPSKGGSWLKQNLKQNPKGPGGW